MDLPYSANVSSEVVSLGEQLKNKNKRKKPASSAYAALNSSSSSSSSKSILVGAVKETPQERARRLSREERFRQEAQKQGDGPKAKAPLKQNESAKRQKTKYNSPAAAAASRSGLLSPRGLRDRGASFDEDDAAFLMKVGDKSPSFSSSPSAILPMSSTSSSELLTSPEAPLKAVVGTCLQLEKAFLRTSNGRAIDASKVRPLFVLEQSLEHIKARWREGESELILEEDERADMGRSGEVPSQREQLYAWASEQLKSLRQDMTVQHIKCTGRNPTTLPIRVYETHARIALEHGDLDEFHQCAAKLASLHRTPLGIKHGARDEFLAYRLLHFGLLIGDKSAIEKAESIKEAGNFLRVAAAGLSTYPCSVSGFGAGRTGLLRTKSALALNGPKAMVAKLHWVTSQTNATRDGIDKSSPPKKKKEKKAKRFVDHAKCVRKGNSSETGQKKGGGDTKRTSSQRAAALDALTSLSFNATDLQADSDAAAAAAATSSSTRCATHALVVLHAYRAGNYARFFDLYRSAPAMSAYLMDFLVVRCRNLAYRRILKAYSAPTSSAGATPISVPPSYCLASTPLGEEKPKKPKKKHKKKSKKLDAERCETAAAAERCETYGTRRRLESLPSGGFLRLSFLEKCLAFDDGGNGKDTRGGDEVGCLAFLEEQGGVCVEVGCKSATESDARAHYDTDPLSRGGSLNGQRTHFLALDVAKSRAALARRP